MPARGHSVEHVVANDAATLVYLAGQASITLHAWLSRRDRLEQPDRMIFDLDPSAGTGHAEVREAAVTIGELLREIGLTPWPMTTGSRGYHVTVPLRRGPDHDTVRAFAREVAELAIARHPGSTFTLEQRKAKREGRILIDIMRNADAHTAVAPYAVRARVGAPVATPVHWEELRDSSTRPDRWTLQTVPDRVARDGDPWHEIAKSARGLSAARKRLKSLA